jgi:type IV pilus assembly protein PilW
MSNCSIRRPAKASGVRQRGLTLVEMMVAMTIALFLLGGVLLIVQHTRATFTNTNRLTQLQEGQRLAVTIITDVVQSAGYFPDPTTNTASSAFPTLSPYAAGQVVTGTHAASTPQDTLGVRYMTASGDGILNCLGGANTTGAAVTYSNVFHIDSGSLLCDLDDGTATTSHALIDGVEDLQIWYGVKRDFTADNFNVDTYLREADMSAADWRNVTCVRVVLVFTNPLKGQPGQPDTIPFERVIALMNRAGVRV